MYPTRYFPERFFAPRYWPPGAPARGSKTVPRPPRKEATGAREVSDLQLVRPVRMVPFIMVDGGPAPEFEHQSEMMGPVNYLSWDLRYQISLPPPAAGDVKLLIRARADLGDANEFLNLLLNMQHIQYLFADTGHACPETPDEVEVTLSSAEWAGLLALGGGNLDVCLVPMGPVVASECVGDTWVSVRVRYVEDVMLEPTPPYMTWRSETEVLLGDGRMDYLWGEWAYDPVTGAMIVVVPSATLNKVTLAGLNVGGRDEVAPAYTCAEANYEIRGVVVRFSGAGLCTQE